MSYKKDCNREMEDRSRDLDPKGEKNTELFTTSKLPKKTSAKVSDHNNPAWTEDMLGAPVVRRGRGPQVTPTKVLTSIGLDADMLEYFKSQGTGYQSRISDTLRSAVDRNLSGHASAKPRKRATA